VVRVKLSELQLRRPRQWGACWLALLLWRELQLDQFWCKRLGVSRKEPALAKAGGRAGIRSCSCWSPTAFSPTGQARGAEGQRDARGRPAGALPGRHAEGALDAFGEASGRPAVARGATRRAEMLQRLSVDPRNYAGDQPGRSAHLNDGDKCAILIQSGERSAQVIRLLHGAPRRLFPATMMPCPRRSPYSDEAVDRLSDGDGSQFRRDDFDMSVHRKVLTACLFARDPWPALTRLSEGRSHRASARVFGRRRLVERPIISLRWGRATLTARWERGTSCPRAAPAQSARRESRRKRVP